MLLERGAQQFGGARRRRRRAPPPKRRGRRARRSRRAAPRRRRRNRGAWRRRPTPTRIASAWAFGPPTAAAAATSAHAAAAHARRRRVRASPRKPPPARWRRRAPPPRPRWRRAPPSRRIRRRRGRRTSGGGASPPRRGSAPCSSNAARSSFRSPRTQRRPVACSATPSSVGPTCAIAAHASATAPSRPSAAPPPRASPPASRARRTLFLHRRRLRVVGECGDDPVDAARRDDRLRGVDVAAEVGEGGAPLRLQLDVGLVGVQDGDDERRHAVLHQRVDRLLRRLAGEVGDGADALEGDLGVRLVAGERVDEPRAARRLQACAAAGRSREVGERARRRLLQRREAGRRRHRREDLGDAPASVIVCRLRRWWHARFPSARHACVCTDGCAAVASIAAHISFTSSALATPRSSDRVCFHPRQPRLAHVERRRHAVALRLLRRERGRQLLGGLHAVLDPQRRPHRSIRVPLLSQRWRTR